MQKTPAPAAPPTTKATPLSAARTAGVVIGLALPTAITAAYFLPAEAYQVSLLRTIYSLGKLAQFLFPLLWVFVVLRRWAGARRAAEPGTPLSGSPGQSRPSDTAPTSQMPKSRQGSGLLQAAVFAAAVLAAMVLGNHFWLRYTPMMHAAAAVVAARLKCYGVNTPSRFIILGLFYCAAHSGLEEYYWRWFVFGQLRRLLRLWPAVVISSLGFMAHHVLVLGTYFRGSWWAAVWFSLAVAIGGAFWAWLFDRTRSLAGPWLSHALVDAGIFWVGYQLVFRPLP